MKIFNYELDITSSIEFFINFLNDNYYNIIGLSLLFFLALFIIFIFVSFIIIKLLKTELDNNSIIFYDYNKKEKQLLEKYGNCIIEQIYIVKHPFNNIIDFAINVITLYKYKQIISESKEYLPHHTQFILNIRLPTGEMKMIQLEKNNSVSLSENFPVYSNKKMKCLNIKKKKYTLNKLLDETRERIGDNVFFNWHIYRNNCQNFSKEILYTLGKLTNKNKVFLNEDKILQRFNLTEFMLHILNCICVVLNIFEKYIYNFF